MQRTQQRLAAIVLSAIVTLLMLVGTEQIATSAPPAALVAQMAQAAAQG